MRLPLVRDCRVRENRALAHGCPRLQKREDTMRFRQTTLTALVAGLFASTGVAQQAFDPLNASEIDLARSALLTNATARQSLGSSPRFAVVNVERHIEGKGVTPAGR